MWVVYVEVGIQKAWLGAQLGREEHSSQVAELAS